MCSTDEANAQWKKLDAQRVQAVAAMLPDQPAGFGKPITDREAWDALAKHPALRGAASSAEKLAKTPIPDMPDDLYLDFSKTGNRTRWQRVNGQWSRRVSAFAMAECLEGKGRFLKPLGEIIRAYCAQRTWVMPAHDRGLRNFHRKQIDIDLFSSGLGWTFATIDYVMGGKLSPDTRQLMRSEVKRRILDPYRDMVEGKRGVNWWMRTTNNWNAVCLAGVTGAGLARVESKLDRASFIVAAEQYSKNFLRGFTSDGYCSEGVGYWNYGFGRYVQLCE